MTQNTFLAKFANEPALLGAGTEAAFDAHLASLAAHPLITKLETGELASGDDFWTELGSWSSALRPYEVKNGILMIPVKGVLLNNFPYTFFGYATGYDYIEKAFMRGMADGDVKGVALVIDSPGGMVAGCFDAVDAMFAKRGTKPVRAFASESAYSAAYAIFSVADHGVVSRTGGVGSIGVVTTHVSVAAQMEQRGIKVTFVHAGKHKVDGNPYQDLSADVKARMQARIDSLYDIFVSSVARNRDLDEQAVRDTEALCFSAADSLSNGLADSIGRLDDALAVFAADLSEPQGEEAMSAKDESAANQAAIDDAVAAALATAASDQATAVAEARAEERTRISTIMNSDEAKGRGDLASHLALETDTAADAAVAILGKSPKAQAEGQTTPFENAMDGTTQPGIEAENNGGGDENAADADGQATVALMRSAGVAGIRPASAK